MEHAVFKSKWANWKFVAFVIILIAIFVKFFILKEHDQNAPVTVALNLEQVAFRNEKEVEALLGPGKLDSYYKDAKAGCDKCPKLIYREGKIDIIYINEIADRITLHDLSDFDFEDKTILGLLDLKENIKPTFEDDGMKRWDNYQKFTQISAFSKSGNIDYIVVKGKEE